MENGWSQGGHCFGIGGLLGVRLNDLFKADLWTPKVSKALTTSLAKISIKHLVSYS